MLELNNLEKRFDDKLLFKTDIVKIKPGYYFLTGENGSGKSTMFQLLTKFDNDYQGIIKINNIDIKNINNSELRLNYITYIKQKNVLFEELSFEDNLKMLIAEYDEIKLHRYCEQFNMTEKFANGTKLKKFSGGEKQKVQIIINLLKDTPILLIDEADNNLDTNAIEALVEILKETSNKIILIITHDEEYYSELLGSKLRIEDKQLKLIEASESEKFEFKEVVNKPKKFSNKELKILQRTQINNTILMILMIMIFSFASYYFYLKINVYEDFMQTPKQEFKDNIALVRSPVENPLYFNFGDKSWQQTTKYYFTEEDRKQLNDLEYIKKINPIGELNSTINSNQIEYNNKKYVIPIEQNNYRFKRFQRPQILRSNTPYDHAEISKIIIGDFPKDESDEILIGETYAKEYAAKNKVTNISKLIGTKIDIPVQEVTESGIQSAEETISFTLAGIYKSSNLKGEEPLFLAYNEDVINVKRNNCFLYEKDLQNLCIMSGTNGIEDGYRQELFKNNQLGLYPNFYVELDSAEDMKQLVTELNDYDPYIYVDSNYSRSHNSNQKYIQGKINAEMYKYIGFIIMYAVILILISELRKKQYRLIQDKLDIFGIDRREAKRINKKINYKIILIALIIMIVNLAIVLNMNSFEVGSLLGLYALNLFVQFGLLLIIIKWRFNE